MCKISPRSDQPFQRRFFEGFYYFLKPYGCRVTWPMTSSNFFVDHFIPRWLSIFFILIGCSIIHMQLWYHNKGSYDVIKKITYSPWEVLCRCQVSIFSMERFRRCRGPTFLLFPTWLPHHMNYDIIIIIKTFYMSIRTDGENLVSIRQVVAEKRE